MTHAISHEVRAFHHGQMDCSLVIRDQGSVLACLDYSSYEGEAHIQMIKVDPQHLRRGYATRLLADLQARFPEREINWGSLTEDGVALRDALPTREIDTPSAPDFARLKRLKLRLEEMADEISRLHSLQKCQRAAITAYYCLERHVSDLADRLWDQSPTATILDLPSS